MTQSKEFQVAIVGGGIAGLTLAIALYHRGVPITVYEAAHKFSEIGAGVSFTPNAIAAMKVCHPGVYEACQKVATFNLWDSKQKVWFDYLNGYETGSTESGHQETEFTISNSLGQRGVHRAHYLDELVKLLPPEVARFGKRLSTVTEKEDGKLAMSFEDGTIAEADVIVGCDGIKSHVRPFVVGFDHPSVNPSYTHKYAYRGLVPMELAIEAIGEERAQNACMHMGPDGHVLTFPVNHGKTLNIVAFHTSAEDWPDSHKLTKPATREEALRDFEGFGANVTKLLKLTKPDLDIWAIFDLGDNPVPTFYKGRVCIAGDAAHATSPHHGAGAGFCIEDSAILAELLADERVHTLKDLEAVMAAYDASRRERTQWLVQSSRIIGDCVEWRHAVIGQDFKKIEAEINRRNGVIANVDLDILCQEAKEELGKKLELTSTL